MGYRFARQMASTAGVLLLSATALTAAAPSAGAAELAQKARRFKNCTAMHRVYPSGVGRVGAIDRVSTKGRRVTTFKRSNALYLANRKLDRDRDGIACERYVKPKPVVPLIPAPPRPTVVPTTARPTAAPTTTRPPSPRPTTPTAPSTTTTTITTTRPPTTTTAPPTPTTTAPTLPPIPTTVPALPTLRANVSRACYAADGQLALNFTVTQQFTGGPQTSVADPASSVVSVLHYGSSGGALRTWVDVTSTGDSATKLLPPSSVGMLTFAKVRLTYRTATQTVTSNVADVMPSCQTNTDHALVITAAGAGGNARHFINFTMDGAWTQTQGVRLYAHGSDGGWFALGSYYPQDGVLVTSIMNITGNGGTLDSFKLTYNGSESAPAPITFNTATLRMFPGA